MNPLGPCEVTPVPITRRRPTIFQEWWLTSFGLALGTLYLLYLTSLYRAGTWLVDGNGLPIYTDFGFFWEAGLAGLHGNIAALYDPGELARLQAALFRPGNFLYPNWAYPPIFLLVLAPLALLPYRWAFVAWDVLTLLGSVAVVYLIVGRRTAIALALAAPFTAWNLLAAQNGFLTAAVAGASLLALARRPVLAGICIGCLTYKPQFGILFPIALVASRQWRAIAAAGATATLLAILSAVVFGTRAWAVFPHALMAQSGLDLLVADGTGNWGYLASLYGFVRLLHGGAALAWLLQGAATIGLGLVVWRVWRSDAVHPVKAGILSVAALLATPYVFAYDMAALVIPAAFLAVDQLRRGLLPGEKAIWIGLFGIPLALLVTLGDNAHGPTFGGVPAGLVAALALLVATLRRGGARSRSALKVRHRSGNCAASTVAVSPEPATE